MNYRWLWRIGETRRWETIENCILIAPPPDNYNIALVAQMILQEKTIPWQKKPLAFWRRRLVQAIVPWATSLSFHIGILAVGLILLPTLVSRVASQTSKEQIIVPDATLTDSHPGGLPNPGLGNDPTRQAAQENDPTASDAKGWAQRKSDSLAETLKSSPIDTTNPLAMRDQENASLNALQSSGDVSTFGPRSGGGGTAPQSRIFGHGGNARKIIYICDGSGSLVGAKEDVLKIELKNAVANLAPIQAFNVLIFQESEQDGSGTHYLSISDSLEMATPHHKTLLYDFLNPLVFQRSTNPIPALEEAFRQQPQLIFLLTDGDFENPNGEQVLERINELNADKKVRVNTILLLGSKAEKDAYTDFEVTMTKIATENGGVYKKFYCDDF